MALSGCQHESSGVDAETETGQGPSAGGGGSEQALSTSELDKLEKPTPRIRMGICVPTREDPFYARIMEAAEAEASESDSTTTAAAPFSPALTAQTQSAALRDMVAKKISAIVVVPVDTAAVEPVLREIRSAGVVVVTAEVRVPGAEDASVYVDDEMGGRLAGEEMLDVLNALGSTAVLEGDPANARHRMRVRGFVSGLQNSLDIAAQRPTGGTEEGAAKAMRATLEASPTLNGVFCVDEVTAMGALKALRGAGLHRKVKLICMGCRPAVEALVESTDIHAAVDFHPDRLGKYAAKAALALASNHIRKGRLLRATLELKKASNS
jgi:ribose transport system substrate-binding protein